MRKTSVLLLMSGGVDSSVAGALLVEQGMDVVGVTLKQLEVEPTREQSGGCCSYGDVRDAKHVAAVLGIPHYTMNTSKEFRERVILPFIRSYQSGLTPNPCVHCNSYVRFEEAFALAEDWGCEFAATGHYAQLLMDESGEPHLYRAAYRQKDQSYFLFGVRKALLKNLLFPLGDKTKEEVRRIAGRLGLITAQKAESQEICFTLGRSYQDFLVEQVDSSEGPILDQTGQVLGKHRGVMQYTVGQRRGLGLAGGPYYVCAIDPVRNAVIVGRKADLGTICVSATDARWIHKPKIGDQVSGQIRSRHQPAAAVVREISDTDFRIEFVVPQIGIAPGQALVLSQGEEILGGGLIQSGIK